MNRNRSWACWFAVCLSLVAMKSGTAQTETVLHNFASPPKGANPYSAIVSDGAGNLYGTTANGGLGGAGVVYEVDPSGHETVLYNFKGKSDGATPLGGVILDEAGNVYGTAVGGGEANHGVVYKLDPAGTETVLYSFTGGADGAAPQSSLARDNQGKLYGTTYGGGSAGLGVVYSLDVTGHETVLHSFAGGSDGENPVAGVIFDAAGDLYGTTGYGGSDFFGVVYEINAAGQETVLHSFTGNADGAYPYSGLTRDAEGNLYGTTAGGGSSFGGLVYKLSKSGHETVIYTFTGGLTGQSPEAGVVRDAAGNLYGTTLFGGSGNYGLVYKIDPAGQETVLYNLPGGAGGSEPYAGLFRDSAGNLYGTTLEGGAGYGVVYKVSAAHQGMAIFRFPEIADGFSPYASVIRDPNGDLYGATYTGGTSAYGTVYAVGANGSEKVLYSFEGGSDGANPYAGLAQDAEGNLYGTTESGGLFNDGIVFKLTPGGEETVLHTFTGGADGGLAFSGVTLDRAGNLYGTAYFGGTSYGGVVYKIDPAGVQTVLYNFTAGSDGGGPAATVTLDAAGNLYGTTAFGGNGFGVVYKVDTSGRETVLHAFTGGADGSGPESPVTLDDAGNLYGTTTGGGDGFGVVYQVEPAGNETVLYRFTGGSDGAMPFYSGVVRDPAGNLFGTTQSGGGSNNGVVYKLSPDGVETVLLSFNFNNGANPLAGVFRSLTGSLYGTTSGGGTRGSGVVFELKP